MTSLLARFLCSQVIPSIVLLTSQVSVAQDTESVRSAVVPRNKTNQIVNIVKVTDLSDSLSVPLKPGTLRSVITSAPSGSTITFTSRGTIRLLAPLEVTTPNLTIDGTSNPIVIIGDSLRIRASGTTLKHLWMFAGDNLPSGSRPGINGHSKPGERDAVAILGNDSPGAPALENTTIDHCWIGFGIDECLSTYGRVDGLTVTHSIIGYGLNRSLHPKDLSHPDAPGHGKGVLIGLNATNVTFRENLLLHNFDRNLAVREGVTNISFINNVVYNFGRGNTFTVGGGGLTSTGIFAGNVFIAGKESWRNVPPFRPADPETSRNFQVFGNVGTIDSDADVEQALARKLSATETAQLSRTKFSPPDKAYHDVLHIAGPHPALNDALSKRAVSEVFRRTGGVIDYILEPRNPAALQGLGLDLSLEALVPVKRLSSHSFAVGGARVVP
jgi:hypothetical protein